MVLSYKAAERDEGRKVYHILRGDLRISSTLLRRMKVADAIKLDGVTCFTDRRIHAGETLTADVSAAEPECDLIPEHGEVEVLYETDGLLAVRKPSGVLIHPTHSKNEHTLANLVAGYLAQNSEAPVCHAVNRLDRDTSGVVLFAKNTYMKALLCEELSNAEKRYLALAYGKMEGEGTVALPIRRISETEMKRMTAPDGAPAITHYRVLETRTLESESYSLVELRLETGRTHQIRVHLAALGHPLLGDRLYGTEKSQALSVALGITSQALHADSLRFRDPISGEILCIRAENRSFS